jgi:hypothetical protein
VNPAFSSASSAAYIAYWAKRSSRRMSFLSIRRVTSKSLTSAAIWTGMADASKRETRAVPERASFIADQVLAASFPQGVTAPSPVTTTRRFTTYFATLLLM